MIGPIRTTICVCGEEVKFWVSDRKTPPSPYKIWVLHGVTVTASMNMNEASDSAAYLAVHLCNRLARALYDTNGKAKCVMAWSQAEKVLREMVT